MAVLGTKHISELLRHDRDIVVTSCGRICMYRKKINISGVLAGQTLEQKTLQPLDNPFGMRLSPMS